MKTPFTLILCCCHLLLCILLSSCTGVGPHVLPPDRYGLNESLQNSDSQQLLINIVRLRYSDAPYFLGISAITSVFFFTVNSASTLEYSKVTDGNTSFSSLLPGLRDLSHTISKILNVSIAPSSSYTQQPTISYTPLQGDVFTKQLLTPMSIDEYFLLATSASSAERLIRLTLQSMGTYENITNHAYVTDHSHEYQGFNQLARLIAIAQDKKIIRFNMEKIGDYYGLELVFQQDKLQTPEAKQLHVYFEKNPKVTHINLVAKSLLPKMDAEYYSPIMTRSVMGMLMYLSRGVQVPQEDIINHRVDTHRLADGTLVDWTQLTRGMMSIKSSKTHPAHAAVAVRYRNRWFYIDDNDVESKQTLSLLEEVFALRAASVEGRPPPVLSVVI